MTPADAPTVFVIDDDAAVRASIQGLLKSVRLAFRVVRDGGRVPAQQAVRRAKLSGSGREASRRQRSGLSAPVG